MANDDNTNLPPSDDLPNDPVLPDPNAPQPPEGDLDVAQGPEEDQDELFMTRNGSGLGGGPGKVIAFGVVMLVVVGFVLYSLFSSNPQPVARGIPAVGGLNNVGDAPVAAPAPPPPSMANSAPAAIPPAPPAPPPPPAPPKPPEQPVAAQTQATPTPPPPPPPAPPKPAAPPVPPPIKPLSPIGSGSDKNQQARLRSNMMVLANPGAKQTTPEEQKQSDADAELDRSDPNKAFTSNVLAASKAQKEVATRLSNLNLTIAQGKIIDAVIETAINTDLPGTIRAIVSRDVYAESGRQIMIPKGSRLIGTYNTGVARGQVRVLVVWTRLIRPDGVDMAIGSPGVDALGRAGIEGIADNKYTEIFSAAILTSALNIGVAVAVDALSNQGSTTTTNANGTTVAGSAAAPGGAAAIASLGSISKDVVNSMLDLRPTITIDQGTRVNVFVNKDLIFPGAIMDKSFVE